MQNFFDPIFSALSGFGYDFIKWA